MYTAAPVLCGVLMHHMCRHGHLFHKQKVCTAIFHTCSCVPISCSRIDAITPSSDWLHAASRATSALATASAPIGSPPAPDLCLSRSRRACRAGSGIRMKHTRHDSILALRSWLGVDAARWIARVLHGNSRHQQLTKCNCIEIDTSPFACMLYSAACCYVIICCRGERKVKEATPKFGFSQSKFGTPCSYRPGVF